MRRTALLFAIISVIASAQSVWAWDSPGHEQIADIAWTHLTPHAKAEIAKILKKGDPVFQPKKATDASLRTAFRTAATFPDVIKGNHTTIYESIIDKMNRKWLPQPNPSDNEDSRCKTWHYYDTPIRVSTGSPQPRESNALKALTFARGQLAALEKAKKPKRKMQAWWLCWIEHVTGDLHQPLHCASSYGIETA